MISFSARSNATRTARHVLPLPVDDRRKPALSVLNTALSARPQSGKVAKTGEIALQRARKVLTINAKHDRRPLMNDY